MFSIRARVLRALRTVCNLTRVVRSCIHRVRDRAGWYSVCDKQAAGSCSVEKPVLFVKAATSVLLGQHSCGGNARRFIRTACQRAFEHAFVCVALARRPAY